MDILLIAGLWLDGSAWDEVVPELEARGHRPVPVTLPGQGDGQKSATLDDQAAAGLRFASERNAGRVGFLVGGDCVEPSPDMAVAAVPAERPTPGVVDEGGAHGPGQGYGRLGGARLGGERSRRRSGEPSARLRMRGVPVSLQRLIITFKYEEFILHAPTERRTTPARTPKPVGGR